MYKHLLVIGRVTARQYQPLRQQINLLGNRARVTRYPTMDFICLDEVVDDEGDDMAMGRASELFFGRHGMTLEEYAKKYNLSESMELNIWSKFFEKARNEFLVPYFQKLGDESFVTIVMDEETAHVLCWKASVYARAFRARYHDAQIWVVFDNRLVDFDAYQRLMLT